MQYRGVALSDYLRLVDGCDVLSLDVFDTAVLRVVAQPIDVFELVARQHRHHARAEAFAFAPARVAAEVEARRRAWPREDVTLDEIYDVLALPDGWPRAALRELECDIEGEVCVENGFVKQLYEYARANGKTVVFVSDMYLPPGAIASLLVESGYPEPRLFVSNDVGVTKHSGRLFAHVVDELRVRPERMLHIGDNLWADVAMPLLRGVPALYYERCATRAGYASGGETAASSLYRGLVHNRLHAARDSAVDDQYRFGYAVAGPLGAALGDDARVARLLSDEQRRQGARDFVADFAAASAAFPWLTLAIADVASLAAEAQLDLLVPAERPA
jgi:FMN phosphatase YigB (HAD superfamily)